jgi:hypothetical protein
MLDVNPRNLVPFFLRGRFLSCMGYVASNGSLYFKAMSQHFSGGTKRTTKFVSKRIRCPVLESNPEPHKYETGFLRTVITFYKDE